MRKREITASLLSIGAAAGFAAMTQVGAAVFPHREGLIFNIGIGSALTCILGLMILFLRSRKQGDDPTDHQENVTMGDPYDNSGTNYGHMGPIHLGKQEFQLTDDHLRQILQQLPKGKAVTINAVGGDRATQMGRRIQSAVERAGLQVSTINMIGLISPPPQAPLSIEDRGNHAVITIAPNA